MTAEEVLTQIQERLKDCQENARWGIDNMVNVYASTIDDIAGIMMDNGYWKGE